MSVNVCTGDYYLIQWARWLKANNSLNSVIQKYQSCAEIIYRMNVAQSNIDIDFSENENKLYEKIDKAIRLLMFRNRKMYDVIIFCYRDKMNTAEAAEKLKRGETYVKGVKKEAASWINGYLSHDEFLTVA
jgi:predicted methyltransferase